MRITNENGTKEDRTLSSSYSGQCTDLRMVHLEIKDDPLITIRTHRLDQAVCVMIVGQPRLDFV